MLPGLGLTFSCSLTAESTRLKLSESMNWPICQAPALPNNIVTALIGARMNVRDRYVASTFYLRLDNDALQRYSQGLNNASSTVASTLTVLKSIVHVEPSAKVEVTFIGTFTEPTALYFS